MTARTASTINVLDLFAGCGGFTQGFHSYRPKPGEASPFRSLAAVEFDKYAAATYSSNFTESNIFAEDIKNWNPDPYKGKIDVILGGPPCQGFSNLGKKNPQDPRNKLWREYVKIVAALEPKIFVIENVARFFGSAEYAALRGSNKNGLLRNYNLTEESILNAADYGVPQARLRAIVIATHKDLPPLSGPPRTHGKQEKDNNGKLFEPSSDILPWNSVRSIFEKSPEETLTTELPDRTVEILGRIVPGIFLTSDLHIGRNPTPLSVARYRAIGPGGNRKDLQGKTALIDGTRVHLSTPSWDDHKSGSGDVMGRQRMDTPSVTIRTEFFKPEKGRYLHPVAHRPITHYEAALIQGFPEDFKWCGNKLDIARQIGNAVPVGLAEAIARQIHIHLSSLS